MIRHGGTKGKGEGKENAVFVFRSCGLMAGMERGTLTLLRHIDSDRVAPVVMAPRGEFWDEYRREVPFVSLVDFPFSYGEKRWRRFFRALKVFRSLQADRVIWMHNQIGDFYIWEILASWIATGGRIYISHHNFPAETRDMRAEGHRGTVTRRYSRLSRKKASFRLRHLWARKVVAISPDITRGLVEEWGIPPRRIVTQTRGVDTAVFFPDPRRKADVRNELSCPAGATLFVAVNRLSEEKRIDRLLGCFLRLGRDRRDAVLAIAGDGPLKRAFEERVRKNQILTGRVHFLGHRKDIAVWLQGADYLLLASDKEGQSAVVKEAMACGTIPVVTDSPGSRDISSMIFVAERNARALCRKIKEVLALDEATLTKRRQELVREIRKKYDLSRCTAALLRAYGLPYQGQESY